jgi:hypothetical protein
MTHEEMLTLIRTRFSSQCDPAWKEKDWEIFRGVGPGRYPLVVEYLERVDAHLSGTDWHNRFLLRQIKEKFGGSRISSGLSPSPVPVKTRWKFGMMFRPRSMNRSGLFPKTSAVVRIIPARIVVSAVNVGRNSA